MRRRPILRWTPYNLAHIARHGTTQRDVEEAAGSVQRVEPSYGGRYVLFGSTRAGRLLAVVVESEGAGMYLAITARPASRKERRRLDLASEGST